MSNLKRCPCGQGPGQLVVVPSVSGSKWAYVYGACCAEWEIEFRIKNLELESDECMESAVEAWNAAPRAAGLV